MAGGTRAPSSRGAPASRVLALDGLRGVAILGVVLFHAKFLAGGGIGVAVFFVLSGYLITRLLLAGRPQQHHFYLRRAQRILPALVPLGLFVWLVDDPRIATAAEEPLWSLVVEETFYLAWPMLVLIAGTPRRVFQFAATLAVIVLLWRTTIVLEVLPYAGNAYRSPDSRSDALLVGAALAASPRALAVSARVAAGAAALICLAYLLPWTGGEFISMLVVLPVVTAATAAIIAHVTDSESAVTAILRVRWLGFLGRISYGLYLWHVPLGALLYVAWPTMPRAALLLSTTAAVIVAQASWRWLEEPCLRWRYESRVESRTSLK